MNHGREIVRPSPPKMGGTIFGWEKKKQGTLPINWLITKVIKCASCLGSRRSTHSTTIQVILVTWEEASYIPYLYQLTCLICRRKKKKKTTHVGRSLVVGHLNSIPVLAAIGVLIINQTRRRIGYLRFFLPPSDRIPTAHVMFDIHHRVDCYIDLKDWHH